MLELFELISLAIPKAGTETAVLPITAANILFVLAILRLGRNNLSGFPLISKNFTLVYFLYAAVISISTLANVDTALAKPYLLAYACVMLASPLTLSVGYTINPDRGMKILAWSIIFTSVYGILQFFIGIDETRIQGITFALGAHPEAKNLYRWIGETRVLVKIPSTYHNGSLFAPFLLMGFFLLLSWKKSRLRTIALVLCVIGFTLAGSRCSVAAAAVLAVLIAARAIIKKTRKKTRARTHERKRIFYIAAALTVVLLGVLGISGLLTSSIRRIYFTYIGFTLTDPTASGRTTLWLKLLARILDFNFIEWIRFVFWGINWKRILWTEGLSYFMTQFGVIALGLYLYLLFMLGRYFNSKGQKFIVYGILGSFFIFCLDGAFIGTPTMINFFLMIGIALRMTESAASIQPDQAPATPQSE